MARNATLLQFLAVVARSTASLQGGIMLSPKTIGLLAVLVSASALAAPVKVTIDAGTLVGTSTDGVNSFNGVPFAKAPVGDLRWKAPQKPEKWQGERDATQFQPPCPQPT